jgi:hypothetical protein
MIEARTDRQRHGEPQEPTEHRVKNAAGDDDHGDEQSHAQRPPRWSLGASVGVRAAAAA